MANTSGRAATNPDSLTGSDSEWIELGEGKGGSSKGRQERPARSLFRDWEGTGLRIDWHDFEVDEPIGWDCSAPQKAAILCLNLKGTGEVRLGRRAATYQPLTAGIYGCGRGKLKGRRHGGGRHQFLTLTFSDDFLRRHLGRYDEGLHPIVRAMVQSPDSRPLTEASHPIALTSHQLQIAAGLRQPPVYAPAQHLWFQSKAMELMVEFFFQPPEGRPPFCLRQRQLSRERVQRVIDILNENLEATPRLEELGKRVGCSPYYLSRTFSKEMGMTIQQYLRRIRMERAAELLRQGTMNVTEVALEVGYSSISHFSQTFCQTIGCCPTLYPHAKALTPESNSD